MPNDNMGSDQKRYDAIEMPEWVDYMSELITEKYKKLT